MRPVTATYRLQFRNGVDFEAAAALAPYLRDLGISHLYASPLFAATTGSTHGYDVTDHARFDPVLGGGEGFAHLSQALAATGLGLVLDIVPNHMAASPENPWWASVLRDGRDSPFAGHFDIDWSAPRLVLPILGSPYGDALAAGDIGLAVAGDGFALRAHETRLPLSPGTWGELAAAVGIDLPDGLRDPAAFSAWAGDPAVRARLEAATATADRSLIHRLHEAQAYRLAHWRLGRDGLTYRRFFEVSDLVGVRVEEDAVFDDVHRFLLELVERGDVHGIRVDHVDGLADPAAYLARLRTALPRPVPVWIEKILGHGEALPPDWPVAGTTGYELTEAVTNLLIDRRAEAPLQEVHEAIAGRPRPFDAMLDAAKREVLTRNLAAELGRLVHLAAAALADDPSARDIGADSLRRALVALACAMPVYRTYLADPPASARERDVLEGVAREARARVDLDDPWPVEVLAACLLSGAGGAAKAFRVRFQQVTGALMAKASEDTVFYRHHRLIAANEVGGEPAHLGMSADAFHRAMATRLALQPMGLSATATHDTKRGEDARMRVAAIAEAPAEWAAAVDRFEEALETDGLDGSTRYLFYQALLGAWDAADPALADRLQAYMLKAVREAKRRTSWVAVDTAYEERLAHFVGAALESARFRALFAGLAAPFHRIGAGKSLVQLALKLAAPGIPDIYQGTEWIDLSLVDPDNRRPVDFACRQAVLDGNAPPPDPLSAAKTELLRFILPLRHRLPELFEGAYTPIPQERNRLGFLRGEGPQRLLVLADLTGRGRGIETPDEFASWHVEAAWPDAPADVLVALIRS